MDQLVVIGVIVVFSILDAIGKSMKKRKERERLEAEYASTSAGSGDAGLEYADEDVEEEDRPSSETLVPRDLWEEIAELTGVRVEHPSAEDEVPEVVSLELPAPEPVSLEAPPPDVESEVRAMRAARARLPVSQRGHAPGIVRAEHAIHLSHKGYGTDPSERARSEQDGLDPLAARLNADSAAARSLLRGHDVHSLRQALILSEVLGPPVSMRDEGELPDFGR